MADATIQGVTVTGVPIFGDPFAQDATPEFLGGGLSLNELAALNESAYPGAPVDPTEAFLAPLPEVLPEVIVQPKPIVVPPPVIVPSLADSLLRLIPWLAIAVPGNMGPEGTGNAPDDPSTITDRYGLPPPPPKLPDPILAEPDLPPNWADLAKGGDSSLLEPIRAPGIPIPDWLDDPFWRDQPELEPVTITPPGVTTRSPVLPGSTWDVWLQPVGDPYFTPWSDPYVYPDPGPDPGPGPAPEPYSPPGVDPFTPDPFRVPAPEPDTRAAPDPFSPFAPDPFSPFVPDIIGDPIGDPIATPTLPTPTGSDPLRFAPPQPSAPTPGLDDITDPFLTEFQPEPLRPNADACQCDKKKKPKKKRKAREKCFKGTYVQRAKGTIFRPTEEVPCDAPLPKRVSKRETDTFGRPVPKKRKSKPSTKWKDILDDVFNPRP